MADQRLNPIYADIEVSDEELLRNRQQLMANLAEQKAAEQEQAPTANNKRHYLKAFIYWGPLAAAATIFAVTLMLNTNPGFDANNLEDLERFVAKHGDHQQLFAQVEALKTSDQPRRRLNALAVMSMLGTDDENQIASAQGLVEDPRPEFRAYYLEYLLDYADEAIYSIDYIESLIEREEDDECLYLLGRLLKLALMNQSILHDQPDDSNSA